MKRLLMLVVLSVALLSVAGCFDKALLRIGAPVKAAPDVQATNVQVLEMHETEF